MPTAVKAWACAWKCRESVKTSRKRMEFHEARCFRNPARRACQTCKHLVRDGSYEDGFYWQCGADDVIDLQDSGMRCDCPKWMPAEKEQHDNG